MTENFRPAGTILFGRNMLDQLGYEMKLRGIRKPAMLTLPDFMKKAVKAAGRINFPDSGFITVSTEEPPRDSDFLILAGGKALSDMHAGDKRPRALIPLSDEHLSELYEPLSDLLVVDSRYVSDSRVMEKFLREFVFSISAGRAQMPGKLHIPPSFTFSCRTELFAGDKALEVLPDLLKKKGVRRPLILCDRGIEAAGLLHLLMDEISDGSLKTDVFKNIPRDSSTGVVNNISRLYRERENDGIIAIGGGSVLDTGKGVYLNVSLNAAELREWEGSNRIPELSTPFIAVPTTSGTGSEVTKAAVISDDEQNRKILFISPNLQPDYGILDSRLTESLPPFLTSITGMDALSHALEAFTCLGKNPISDQMAWAAVELIRDHLTEAVENPGNTIHRRNLALASNLAGQAFSSSMVGMVHTIGHSVGAVCHVPHGSCMSVLLPPSLEYNFKRIEPLLAQLLPALVGEKTAGGIPEEEKARESIKALRTMNRVLKEKTSGRHPEKLRDITGPNGERSVCPEDFPEIARTALGDASIIYNPEELDYEDIIGVLKKSY